MGVSLWVSVSQGWSLPGQVMGKDGPAFSGGMVLDIKNREI